MHFNNEFETGKISHFLEKYVTKFDLKRNRKSEQIYNL